MGRTRPQEDPVAIDAWPTSDHVVEQGIAYFLRQRQIGLLSALAANSHHPFFPTDVVEPHGHDVTRP
jgi:hypothetical protein